jgi:hypothetical protein
MIERAFVVLAEGQMHLRRLAGTDPAILHRATLDVLEALDTCMKPYIAAIETALGKLPRASVARVAPGDAAKAAAIATFLAAEAA